MKVLHSIRQEIWKTQQWPQAWKRSVFIPIPKKGNAKECSNYRTIAVHGVAKSRTRLSDFTFTFHFPALEKEMATRSSVLAWRTPGMGEPGGLPSLGSQSQTRLKRLSSSSSSQRILPDGFYYSYLDLKEILIGDYNSIRHCFFF